MRPWRCSTNLRLFPLAGGASILFLAAAVCLRASEFEFDDQPLHGFFEAHCYECHDDRSAKGGLDLYSLSTDLADPGAMQKWVRIFDRIATGEMPPADQPRPEAGEKHVFAGVLGTALTEAHAASKGTVLRRLNRREYQNTLNDLFGTHLDLADTLPEDGRAHEFDTVGEALGLSRVQLQRYLEGIDRVLDKAIAARLDKPESAVIRTSYADSDDAKRFVGNQWLKLPDGAVVQFQNLGYPSGTLRGSRVRHAGFYRVRIDGYAYQSDEPITFAVNADTYERGAEKPTYGYFAFQPGAAQQIEFETWIDANYMLQIKPWGIYDSKREIKANGIENYRGPGLAIASVEIEGPIVREFPTRGHRLIFDGLDRREIEPRNANDKAKSWYVPRFEVALPEGQSPADAAEPVLLRIAAHAFRRPVAEDDVAPYLALFESEMAAEAEFEEALRTAISAIFCSPDFIYLREPASWLDDFALASRLSYFLTRSAPDDELRAAAERGDLRRDPQVLLAQAERLMKGEYFQRFVVDFTDAWLNLRDIDFTVPDGKLFPEFDRYLQWSMLEESRAFFRHLIEENLAVANVVRSDFAMLNQRLAQHYELDGTGADGPAVQRVSLPADSVRGGVLSQASVLKVSANGTNTSPVVRGVWFMERILGEVPAPPPPGIPGVEPDIRGATTLREILDKHRDSESCQSCHTAIDPPGFALESFNPVGSWRERFRSLGEGESVDLVVNGDKTRYRLGQPVDASGQLADGRSFADFNEFRDLLLTDEDRIARALAGKLLTFASGRELGFSDRPELDRIVAASADQGHGLRHLFHLVITSEIFRRK